MTAPNSRFGCLGVFIVVLLCLSVLFNMLFIVGGVVGAAAGGLGQAQRFNEMVVTDGVKEASTKIAVIRVSGLIANSVPGSVTDSMVDDIKLQLKQALEDKDVKAIVLAVDSPGGEVTASDIIYNAVKKAKEQKPVVVSMGSLAASGGYYIACGGSHVFAHDTTFTGSIGVIMQSLNYTDLMGKVGLEMVTFKSGKFKDMLSGARKMSPEEAEYLQAMIMQTYSKFVGIVATSRGLDEAALRAGVADGRVISGQDALKEKLVDEIGDFDAAVKKAMQLGNATGASVIRYEGNPGLGRLLRSMGRSQSKSVEVNVGVQSEFKLEAGRLYLLPGVLVP